MCDDCNKEHADGESQQGEGFTSEQIMEWLQSCLEGPVKQALVFMPTDNGFEVRRYPSHLIDEI